MTDTTNYCTVSDVNERAGLEVPAKIVAVYVAAASRRIDMHCARRFWQDTEPSPRVFSTQDATDLDLDDISIAAGVAIEVDNNADGTFDASFTSGSDYQLEPLNQICGAIEGHPYTKAVALTPAEWPTQYQGRALVRVTARWGWAAVPPEITALCIDIAARAIASELGAKSEQIGGYQIVYADAIELTPAEQATLEPYRKG